jgi:hypothetical protein
MRFVVGLIFMLFVSLSATAQKQAKGTIINAKDKAAVGFATVTVKGTTLAVVSNADGSFGITLPEGKSTLIISSVGYATQEVDASSGNVNVVLVEATSSLDEIVVTGYTASAKKI